MAAQSFKKFSRQKPKPTNRGKESNPDKNPPSRRAVEDVTVPYGAVSPAALRHSSG